MSDYTKRGNQRRYLDKLAADLPWIFWSRVEDHAQDTTDGSFLDDELHRIARATELDSVEIATPDRLNALRDRVREILEGE